MRLRNDKRDQRKREAEARNAAWRALTPEQQVDSLNDRGARACRQRKAIFDKHGVGIQGSK